MLTCVDIAEMIVGFVYYDQTICYYTTRYYMAEIAIDMILRGEY